MLFNSGYYFSNELGSTMNFHPIREFEHTKFVNLHAIAEAIWESETKVLRIRMCGEPEFWQEYEGHVAESLHKALEKRTL